MSMNDSKASSLALEVGGISKRFGSFEALRDISFELGQGEFLTMLGPSGSGKTTTLRVIAGFLSPDSGFLKVHGRDVIGVPPNRRSIGMVFQDYALFPHMNVAQNVAFPLEARGIGKAESKRTVESMIGVVGLTGMEERMPRQLSGGQQQRVALARALVFNPELVLLDEPLAALDKKLRAAMQLEILRITKQLGATVISVTHDQEEALVMSDRIALFSQGHLVQIGTPQELYSAPKTQFVADFIGDANILPARVVHDGGNVHLDCMGFKIDTVPSSGVAAMEEGTDVKIIVRPEKMAVHGPQENGRKTPNRLSARTKQVVYLGVECKIIATLGDIPVQVRSRELEWLGNSEGDAIDISWKPEDAVILAAQ